MAKAQKKNGLLVPRLQGIEPSQFESYVKQIEDANTRINNRNKANVLGPLTDGHLTQLTATNGSNFPKQGNLQNQRTPRAL